MPCGKLGCRGTGSASVQLATGQESERRREWFASAAPRVTKRNRARLGRQNMSRLCNLEQTEKRRGRKLARMETK
jgi:hypothetical protein